MQICNENLLILCELLVFLMSSLSLLHFGPSPNFIFMKTIFFASLYFIIYGKNRGHPVLYSPCLSFSCFGLFFPGWTVFSIYLCISPVRARSRGKYSCIISSILKDKAGDRRIHIYLDNISLKGTVRRYCMGGPWSRLQIRNTVFFLRRFYGISARSWFSLSKIGQ